MQKSTLILEGRNNILDKWGTKTCMPYSYSETRILKESDTKNVHYPPGRKQILQKEGDEKVSCTNREKSKFY